MKKLRNLNITNTIIKLFFFFAFPAAWATGFSGIKYICQQVHSGKPIEMKAFLIAFLALSAFTIVFGRFFCGRACAFGTYGDMLYYLAKLIVGKLHRKLPGVPHSAASVLRYGKYAVLVLVCLLCIVGRSDIVASASPWTAFSNLRTGNISLESTLDIAGLTLFIILSLFMMFTERFFCRFLCPFGAVFSLLPVLPFSAPARDRSKCLGGCKACKSVCPASLDLPYHPVSKADSYSDAERDYAIRMGECFQCGKCAHVCPRTNAGCGLLSAGTKGIIIDICKAVILAVILYKVV